MYYLNATYFLVWRWKNEGERYTYFTENAVYDGINNKISP